MNRSRRARPDRPTTQPAPVPASGLGDARAASLLPLGAVAAGFGMLTASAFAQTAPAPAAAASAPDLPRVTVRGEGERDKDSVRATTTTIGKGRQDLRDIPQSVNVMTEKLLDDVKLDTLKDALHYSGGITFAATENGTDQDIRLRGFPVATTGDLMIDGMRDPSQYDRDTFNYERIEVMRGSASMLFGRGSTGGVINQVTKKPELLTQSDVTGSIGSRGYLRATGDFNVRTGETSAVRVNIMGTKADNGGANVAKHGLAPAFSWGIGTADQFTVGAFHLKTNNIPFAAVRYVGGSVAKVEPGDFYGTRDDFVDGEASYVHGSWLHRFADGGELRSQIRTGVFDRAQWSTAAGTCGGTVTAAGACPAGSPTVLTVTGATQLTRSGLTPRKDRYKGTYVQTDYSREIQLGGMTHSLLAGLDAARESADRFQNNGFLNTLGTRPGTSVGSPGDNAGLIGTGRSPLWRNSSTYAATSWGAYVQDLIQVAPMWKVLAGLRYDNFKGDFTTLPINNTTGVVTPSSASISESPFSYRAGLLFQPTSSLSFHFSYGTSFTTAADTYQYVSPQNANTPPEKSRNIELGAKLDWLDNKLSTRVAVFRSQKYNERTTDADFAGSAYLLSGKRHSQGVELEVVGRVTPKMEVYASVAYIPEAKIDAAGSTQAAVVGQRSGLTPKGTGSVWVSYQFTPALRVGVGAHGATVNRPLQGTNGAASATAKAPGYVAGDMLVEYKFNPDQFLQLNVSNIGNKLYGDQLYPGFTISGAPRMAQLTFGQRF